MTDPSAASTGKLTESASYLLNSILESSPYKRGAPPYVLWWCHELLTRRGPMAQDIMPGLDVPQLVANLAARLEDLSNAPMLSIQELSERAYRAAQARGADQANDRDVVRYALSLVDRDLVDEAETEADREAPSYEPQLSRPTPTLDGMAENLTMMAARGRLSRVLGRDDEIRQMIETLCRAKKRNPALIGPAGVGKTALVEGLAQRIVSGEVPELLQGCVLYSLPTSALVAGAGVVGELEKRLAALLEEAAQDKVLLFIDEVHSIMGAGGKEGQGDVATLLKPALARGDIACIVATTDGEYRRYITRDPALERRFNPVLVNEVSAADTVEILKAFRRSFQDERPVAVGDEVLELLVRLADRFMRNRHFPDKALDLLDHCVASAVTRGKSSVFADDARAIVQARVGMPLDLEAGLAQLAQRLTDAGLLESADVEAIKLRMLTTTENLDLSPREPNLSLLLTGAAAQAAPDLAGLVAETVFGSGHRVVTVDLARLTSDDHINVLVGSPAGYIGHGDPLPHDPVQQMPWCVVVWRNVDACHESIRQLLARIMSTGELRDNRGQTVHFSDTVIIATAATGTASRPGTTATIGFEVGAPGRQDTAEAEEQLRKTLGKSLVDQFDLVLERVGAADQGDQNWVQENVLDVAAERYAVRGLDVVWDESFVAWLTGQKDRQDHRKEWEGVLDHDVGPLLRPHLDAGSNKVRVCHDGDKVVVVPVQTGGA